MNFEDAPCVGKSRLFDATDARSHAQARALCATCPAIADCRRNLIETQRQQMIAGPENGPEGTWAGVLLPGRRPSVKKAVA